MTIPDSYDEYGEKYRPRWFVLPVWIAVIIPWWIGVWQIASWIFGALPW